ncbi:hypothetical protein PIB30_090569 [Stylosanthes scabra]|uniref:Uncharacterized protein n=1 Tax=Stylosanthes scabra TaxID=79078 RepID=A0ABU6ZSY1_9FABA|nr:hypothetical protein [Stylosanthes scabra]
MHGEDPIKHLKDFDVICATTRRTGGDEDAVRAFAFPFSLDGLTPTDKAMIDASAGGDLMNKTPEEAWELIESVVDNHQCFKTRATSSVRGVYEIAPSDTTVLAMSFADIASMLREMKESQQATPKLLTQPSQSSPPPQAPPKHCGICRVIRITPMNVHNCKKIMSLHPPKTTMMDPHKTANTNHNPKGGVTINKGVGIPTNNLNTANPTTTTIHHKIPKTQDTNLHIVGNHTHPTTTPNPLMKKPSDLVNKRTKK